ncbi:MAG: hypothetical protein L3J21_04540 [Devosiaceae bacterium]|nr:hypothetical protein [Devosiaceae bacterium]
MTFKFLASAGAFIAAILTLLYGLAPNSVYAIFSIDSGGPTGDFISRRAAVLFLGYAVLMWGLRNAPPSAERRAVCLAAVVMTGGLALLGIGEVLRGFAGPYTWVPIVLELLLMSGFARLLIRRT